MNKINYKCFSLLFFSVMLLFQCCKKDKVDFESDNRTLTQNRVNSTARIINVAGFNQVIVNGDSLTNFVVREPNKPNSQQYPGTSYFPSNGQLGKTWFIPQDLFDAQETAKLDFMARSYAPVVAGNVKLDVKNDYNNPTDYFLLPTFAMDGQPEVVPVKRGVTAPSKPDHFKIRIVNLSGAIKNPAVNSSGRQEELSGDVSLAYADGTLVDARTNNISSASRTSDYIEIPYGTYQFKILMADGRQMPALGSGLDAITLIDPPTSTIPMDLMNATNQTYAPIQTYQPGGIYTILIAPQKFDYLINELDETSSTYQNSFQVINDNSPSANNTYFRVQGVNGLAAQNVSFKVDGKTIASNLAFGTVGAYTNFIQGSHIVEAIDASGKTIACASQVLRSAQNYTAWLYQDQSGTPKVLIVANDLSGTTYLGTEDDATYSRNQYHYFFFKRFLNLSVGNPYITFTQSNGQSSAGGNDNANAGVNLQPGQPLFERPYISNVFNQKAFEIMAYRSKPNVVPGIWANDIEVLKSEAFIADKTLYQKLGRGLPVQEPGIYTVALIGQSGTGSTPANKARMIIIKHNK
ncbi:DUF4397 domain-containing protein [Pedobacter kyonggii]|uniref:DUF4397 domain-containing protein n=1 Tax=Pedobacter kyonggii TaxID=1926871 RepID=A0A4Q9H9F1_9SPHI|nr:DUF4397 domain-containing protein [Pedobacter kyonggii]TBO40595.1 hypothetical protein EYS08_18270 [Pedobacter kyonggii]